MAVLPLPAPSLVGRGRELDLLRHQFDAALAGRGGLVLIGGEAGIGKSALAEALCREAADSGVLALTGRCYDLAETPPYGPWVELFRRYRRDEGTPDLPAAFSRRGSLGGVASQETLFQQVLDFFAALATRHPLVLLLEDLHWADPASLDLLRFVARNLIDARLLLLATYRSDEIPRDHPLYRLLPALVREAGAARLDPRPLDAAAIRALVDGRYGPTDADAARLAAHLLARGEGNPLFVGELLRALEEAGTLRLTREGWRLGALTATAVPALLRQVIDGRVARLDDASRRLLGVAAAIGHEVPLAFWSAVGEAGEDAVLAAAERGTAVGLLVEVAGEERVRFAHALIREAVYEGMLTTRRRRLHRAIAEAHIATADPDPDAVAYHLQRAADDRAAGWLVAAGERAQRAYAWLTAAERYEAALALTGDAGDIGARGWLLLRFAICLRFARPDEILPHLDAAAAAARAAGDAMLLARTRVYQGLTRCYLGDLTRGIAALRAGVAAQEALAAAGRPYTPLDAVDATNGPGTLADFLSNAGQLAEARARAEAHLAGAPPSPGDAGEALYADTHMAIGMVAALEGRPEEARAHYLRAAAIYGRIGHRHIVVRVMVNALHYVRLPYEADRVGDRRRDAAELTAAVAGLVDTVKVSEPPEATQTGLLLLEGRWAEIRDVVADLDEPASSMVATLTETQGRLAIAQGDDATARALVDRWLPDGPATAPGATFFTTSTAMIRVAAARALDADDGQGGRAWLEAHDRWMAWSGAVLGRFEGRALWAQYHRQAGDIDKAREHGERALAHAGDPRQPLALLAAHRLLGELDTDGGRYDDAARHLDASSALADACQAPYERALTLLARARLCAARGNRDDAMAALDAVRAICAPLGAQPALLRADALAASLAPVAPPPAHPGGLTGREVEVLRHIAAGESNREIAAALSVSVRTVERHIENLYRKIDARSKADATAYAFRHRLA